jgi:hypothetical protein
MTPPTSEEVWAAYLEERDSLPIYTHALRLLACLPLWPFFLGGFVLRILRRPLRR